MHKLKSLKDMVIGGDPKGSALHRRQIYADWFRQFEWSFYCTFTFDREKLSSSHADALMDRYLSEVERVQRTPIPALIVKEEGQMSGLGKPWVSVHFHAVLRAPSHVSRAFLKETWEKWPYGGTGVRPKLLSVLLRGMSRKVVQRGSVIMTEGSPPPTICSKSSKAAPDNWRLRRSHLLGIVPRSWHTSGRIRRSIRRHQNFA